MVSAKVGQARNRLGIVHFPFPFARYGFEPITPEVQAPGQQAIRHAGTPPAFLPARPITHVDLVALTDRVRRRVIRWFRLIRLLDAAAWAKLMARAGEEFPLEGPNYGGDIRLIAFHQSRGRSGRF